MGARENRTGIPGSRNQLELYLSALPYTLYHVPWVRTVLWLATWIINNNKNWLQQNILPTAQDIVHSNQFALQYFSTINRQNGIQSANHYVCYFNILLFSRLPGHSLANLLQQCPGWIQSNSAWTLSRNISFCSSSRTASSSSSSTSVCPRCLYCILGEKGTLKKHDGFTTFFQRNILLVKVRDLVVCVEQKLWGTSWTLCGSIFGAVGRPSAEKMALKHCVRH